MRLLICKNAHMQILLTRHCKNVMQDANMKSREAKVVCATSACVVTAQFAFAFAKGATPTFNPTEAVVVRLYIVVSEHPSVRNPK
jgi:hypothetical protein